MAHELERAWGSVKVRSVSLPPKQIKVGSEIEVSALIDLGALTADDVRVQLYYGQLNTDGVIDGDAHAVDMVAGKPEGGAVKFSARLSYDTSGERGISVRVLPKHPFLRTSFVPHLITWASS